MGQLEVREPMRMWVTGNRAAGFTLLELLVVMAIIAITAGTLVFFATPSSAEKEKKKGVEVLNLMQKARLHAMMERRIYAIDKPEGEASLNLVVLIGEEATAAIGHLDDTSEEAALNGEIFAGVKEEDKKKKKKKPSYETHKAKAESLGLLATSLYPQWSQQEESIVFDEISVVLTGDFGTETPYITDITEDITEESTDLLEEVSIKPEVIFFPDGSISTDGVLQLTNQQGDVVYEFSWDREGKFTY